MYGYTKQWENGRIKWIQKRNLPREAAADLSFDNILTYTLVSCDVKTDVQNETWKVEHRGVLLKHFNIPQTTSWTVNDNIITVYSQSEVPFRLLFFSAVEANKADYRLYLIMNGALIVDCDDDIFYTCSKPSSPTVNFL